MVLPLAKQCLHDLIGGDAMSARSRCGSVRTTTVRWAPPNGGGALTPSIAANIGRTLNSA